MHDSTNNSQIVEDTCCSARKAKMLRTLSRPDLFITATVIGFERGEAVLKDHRPAGHWQLCLTWSDGRRECLDMPETIDLRDGSRLWIPPQPTDPSPSQYAGWSKQGRLKWLRGRRVLIQRRYFRKLQAAFQNFLDLPDDEATGMNAVLACSGRFSLIYTQLGQPCRTCTSEVQREAVNPECSKSFRAHRFAHCKAAPSRDHCYSGLSTTKGALCCWMKLNA